jgi:hypothetical protein
VASSNWYEFKISLSTIVHQLSPQKVVIGYCLKDCNHYNEPDAWDAISQLRDSEAYALSIAGVAVWESSDDTADGWGMGVFAYLAGQMRTLMKHGGSFETEVETVAAASQTLLTIVLTVTSVCLLAFSCMRPLQQAPDSAARLPARIPGRICVFLPCCREGEHEIANTCACFDHVHTPTVQTREQLELFFVVDNTPDSDTVRFIKSHISNQKETYDLDFLCTKFTGMLHGIPCHLFIKGGQKSTLVRGKRYSQILFSDAVHRQREDWWAVLCKPPLCGLPLPLSISHTMIVVTPFDYCFLQALMPTFC